jgi:hypothetical protein
MEKGKLYYIFFQSPARKGRVAFTVSDQSVDELKKEYIIPNNSKTLLIEYKDEREMDMELFLLIYNLDCALFDNDENPTTLVMNKDIAFVRHLQEIRTKRNKLLSTLDGIQMRYMMAGRHDIVSEIEEDKAALRDVPDDIDLSDVETMVQLHNKIPTALLIDYNEKYKDR